jgi:hypothetical protein
LRSDTTATLTDSEIPVKNYHEFLFLDNKPSKMKHATPLGSGGA